VLCIRVHVITCILYRIYTSSFWRSGDAAPEAACGCLSLSATAIKSFLAQWSKLCKLVGEVIYKPRTYVVAGWSVHPRALYTVYQWLWWCCGSLLGKRIVKVQGLRVSIGGSPDALSCQSACIIMFGSREESKPSLAEPKVANLARVLNLTCTHIMSLAFSPGAGHLLV
jgi:hypothetical protein